MEHPFQPYGLPHLTVIFLTIVLPFVLAAIVRYTKSSRIERALIAVLSTVLIVNYIAYLIFVRIYAMVTWRQMLPLPLSGRRMSGLTIALWTASLRWFAES